ncbi:MAG: metalloregulator ArsR/SmtB family transcription factor [Candidatus Obscuribacterales bacterium]|nr:metalloregulator ArsR/SmtB family transcription factor [Candidatus Obscuribacterales bacterium]
MSPKTSKKSFLKGQARAPLFAALGDETRLSLVNKLSSGKPYSISELAEGHKLTRQAITKHLRVLEDVGLVHSIRSGRASLFELDLEPIKDINEYLDFVSRQWDQSLAKLKLFVEQA